MMSELRSKPTQEEKTIEIIFEQPTRENALENTGITEGSKENLKAEDLLCQQKQDDTMNQDDVFKAYQENVKQARTKLQEKENNNSQIEEQRSDFTFVLSNPIEPSLLGDRRGGKSA